MPQYEHDVKVKGEHDTKTEGYNPLRMSNTVNPDYDRLAWDMKNEFGNNRILILPVGYGGSEDFDAYVEGALSHQKLRFHSQELHQSDERNTEYRSIITAPSLGMNKYHAEIAIPFETAITRHGKGITGALIWTLLNSGVLGIKKVYTGTVVDQIGFANFCAWGDYEKYIGIQNFVNKKDMPEVYEVIHRPQFFTMISEHKPEFKAVYVGRDRTYKQSFRDLGRRAIEIAKTHKLDKSSLKSLRNMLML